MTATLAAAWLALVAGAFLLKPAGYPDAGAACAIALAFLTFAILRQKKEP